MPSALHSDRHSLASDPLSTIDRINALLDHVDVDAIESIWNPEPVPGASASPASLAPPPTIPESDRHVVTDAHVVTDRRALTDRRARTDRRAPLETRGLTDERALANAFSNRYLLPLFDPPQDAPLPIDPAVAERLDARYCWDHQIAPLAEEGQTLEVAIAFPEALQLADDFQRRYGKQFRPLFAPRSVIEQILRVLYPEQTPRDAPERPGGKPDVAKRQPAIEETRQRLVRSLLTAAVKRHATAVHLDKIGGKGQVRFRIDGRLVAWKKISAVHVAEILAGLKSRAKLESGNAKAPQSGSFLIRKGSRRVSVRLDSCPTVEGERSVLHFSSSADGVSGLGQLGFDRRQRLEVRGWFAQAPGLVLVSSPPGHGMTTTLYSLVTETESVGASIATLESTVERSLPRAQQLQTDKANGLTYQDGLRALLKQDLDVIMVGQLQDAAMVDLCLQGCLAGSKVIAGLAADSPPTLMRQLLAWGTDRLRIAAQLRGVLFQRLLRKLCSHCRKPQRITPAQHQRYGIPMDCILYQPVGCPHCENRGYSGRLAVFELFDRDSELLRLIASNAPLERFQKPLLPSLPDRFLQAAIRRVIRGETSLAEAVRMANK